MNERWLRNGSLVIAMTCCVDLARAAEITDVADAADTVRIGNYTRDNAFDVWLDDEFQLLSESGRITREPMGRGGCSPTSHDCQPANELQYNSMTYVYALRGQIGMYQDLAFTFGWSYVVDDKTKFGYAKGVTAANSTVDSSDPAIGRLFPHDFQSDHRGAGKLDFGVKWAPLSDERDDSKPMWVLAVNWSTPWTQGTYDPRTRASTSHPGAVGDGMHYLTFSTALSKRLGSFGLIGIDPNANRRGYLDPYVQLSYVWPIPQSGKSLGALTPSDTRPFAHTTSQQGRLEAGFEVVPVEDLRNGRKLAIDLGLRSAYYAEGRNYSELTDPLGRLTYTDQYFYVGGVLGVYAQVAEVLRFKAGFTVGWNSSHFITGDSIGNDRDGNGVSCENGQPVAGSRDVCNPYYDAEIDQPGFRFRDEGHVGIGGFLSMMLTL